MTAFEIPTVVTTRLRAFHAGYLRRLCGDTRQPALTHHLLTGRSEICGAG